MEGKKKVFCLGLVVVAAAFFCRFYRIDQTAPFLGDQGRDLLEIKTALDAGQIPLAGPVSNFGIHAGPLYYYLAIPPLLIANFDPLGPIVFFTFLGVISSLLIFLLAKNSFGVWPAFFAALLYACSPAAIRQTLGFWNPIPIPFFGLLIIWALYQIKERQKYCWLGFLGLFLGLVVQFYPPAFLILGVVLVWVLWQRPKSPRWLLAGLALLFLSFLPLLLFQFQNNFADVKNLLLMVLEKFLLPPATAGAEGHSLINSFTTVFANQFQPLTGLGFWPLNCLLGIIILAFSFRNFWSRFLSLWLLAGILLISLYPGTVHEHYASPIWALPFLLWASFLYQAAKRLPKRLIFGLAGLLIVWQVFSYGQNPPAANDLGRAQAAAAAIIKAAGNRPFALLLLPDRSPSDAHLRYFLSLKNAPLQKIGTTNRLVVVCESDHCPEPGVTQNLKIVDSECLPNCAPLDQQKTFDLAAWQYLSSQIFSGGEVYLFSKSPAD